MRGRLSTLLVLLLCALNAQGSGPRFVTGPPFFTGQPGRPVGWKQTQLLYFTDPGNLSANVSHAQADALVAAAAGVWNVAAANITVSQGGQLAEHVNGTNVYLDAGGLHLPADAMSSNASAVPIAVIYDTDGSVTDTLLGYGASDPSGCRQNAVTESVDAFDPAGYILHALVIVNGRCTGTTSQAQLQLQYQLQRVFGRVLGLAWSQTNDNVFTGSPRATPIQQQNWPIMHPIDILCGLYTYQCLPSPFTLRNDDISGLVSIYPIPMGSMAPAGKQVSLTGAQGVAGWVQFPTGQGMAGVNVLVRRESGTTTLPDAFYIGSAVTGAYFRHSGVSPFLAAATTAAASMGSNYEDALGQYSVAYFPAIGPATYDNILTSTEAVNRLYTGEYSLGPYTAGEVVPAGTPVSHTTFVATPLGTSTVYFTVADAPAVCGSGGDGTRSAPMQAAATGWWNGLLCGYGHASYVQANVKPGHNFTLEITALDAQGLATETKAMPVIGLFAATDAVGALPSLGVTPSAFNGNTVGTTALSAPTGTATSIQFGIADQRGDGRPDLIYQARLFYADSLSPARIAPAGGTLTITGTGFRTGNAVSINGVNVTPTSWTANAIVLSAPAMAAVHATAGVALDVVISDRTTGASSTLSGALIYDASASLPNSMRLLSAPAGTLLVDDVAASPFTVQLIAADGKTPIAGEPVVFSTTTGAVVFGACGSTACKVLTDAAGQASTTVTATAPGAIVLQAIDGALSQTAALNADAQPGAMLLLSAPESSIKVGTISSNWFQVRLVAADGRTGLAGKPVVFSTTVGSVNYLPCATSPCTMLTDQYGIVGLGIIPASIGPITLRASYGDAAQTTSLTGVSNLDTMLIVTPPSDINQGQSALFTVQLLQSDGVTPDRFRTVSFTVSPGVVTAQCGGITCDLPTDYYGRATVLMNPTQAGTFTVQAAYGSVVQSATFHMTVISRQLKIISTPADNSATGVYAAALFSVQLLQPDGVTPITGVRISMAGPPGAVFLPACYAASCEVWVDSRGIASVSVMPLLPGSITMSATYAPLVTTAVFKAVGPGETINFVAQPDAGGAPFGVPQTLTAQVIQADGVTPFSSDAVRMAVLSGPFVLLNTSSAAIYFNTDEHGLISCQGIAIGDGLVTFQASDGYVTKTITFMAGTSPDVMRTVRVPPASVTLGSGISGMFSVQLFASDGVTRLVGKNVTFSVTNGSASLGPCSASVCAVATDATGTASISVTALAAGTIGLLAAEANVSQSTSFIAVRPPDLLRLVSVPAGGGYVGSVGSPAFTVQALLADGVTAAASRTILMSATSGSATLNACSAAACSLVTDAQGMVSTTVTPLAAGAIGLQAVDADVVFTTSFAALARPDKMRVTSAPTGKVGLGYPTAVPFAVQILAGDGVTPRAGKSVLFSAVGIRFTACGASTCTVVTGADGSASTGVVPQTPGTVVLNATEDVLTQSTSFEAIAVPDQLTVVTAPASGGYVGDAAGVPFAVRVLLGDGVTAGVAKNVTISVTQGNAGFSACGGAATCVLQADASGLVSTAVTPLEGGTIVLTAVEGTASVSATFTAAAKPDTLQLVSAPAGSLPTGVPATTAFATRLLLGGGGPDAGKPVVLTSSAAVIFGACGAATCTVTTDANGVASSSVTPVVAGSVTITATHESATQSATFNAVVVPDTLAVVSAPASGGYVETLATLPFTVRVVLGDGSTVAAEKNVTVAVTKGSASLTACAGAGSCMLVTDAFGLVSTAVIPLSAGTITLTATDAPTVAEASFTAVARPDTLQLVSAPSGSLPTGVVALPVFAVRLMQGDGVTPDAGKSVVFSGSGVAFAACAAAPCTVVTGSDGVASTSITPFASGALTFAATYGSLVQTGTATGFVRPDTLRIVSAPAAGSFTGVAASVPFATLVLQGNGVTPASGRSIQLSVASGSASIVECGGAASCVLLSDAAGMVSTAVVPGSEGLIVLKAAEADLAQTASFTAVPRADIMTVLSSPAAESYTGVAAIPFSVAVRKGDGTSPAAERSVVFSVVAGSATLTACGSASACSVMTDADGLALTGVTPQSAGVVTLQAADGAVIRNVSFAALDRPDGMQVVSAPASGSFTGVVAAAPFQVLILQGDGVTPAVGRNVTIAVTNGSATFGACAGASTCALVTDARGIVLTAVTPLAAGAITLQAAEGSIVHTSTFTAVARPDVLKLVSAPAPGSFTGVPAALPFSVVVLQGDGVTAAVGRKVVVSVTTGAATFAACGGTATCTLTTDQTGLASSLVTPVTPGTITLQATDGDLIQTAQFTAIARPDILRVVSSPANGSFTGTPAAVPFTALLLQGDGITPASGKNVTVSVTNGLATLGACTGAPSCSLITDANGKISTSVTPLLPGTITLQATDGSATQSAIFTAANRPDVLRIVSAPAGSVYVGTPAAQPFTVQLLRGDGVTPHAGASVTFSATGAAARLGSCGASCQLVTDANGMASILPTPLAPGTVTLLATAGTLTQSVSFESIANQYALTATPAVQYLAEGATLSLTLAAFATQNGTVAAGQTVAWTGTAGFTPRQSTTITNAAGTATVAATLTGSGTIKACAWTDTCAISTGVAVPPAQFAVTVNSGAAQAVTGGASYAPVVAQVTDLAAHPVAGAAVTVYQTVTAMDVPCPDRGRCPAAPVLASLVTATTTDAQGRISIAPLTVAGRAVQTQLLFSAGTAAFTSSTLSSAP